MCDTFVALGNSTESGSVLLAKSADTEVNEAEKVANKPDGLRRNGARMAAAQLSPAGKVPAALLGNSGQGVKSSMAIVNHGAGIASLPEPPPPAADALWQPPKAAPAPRARKQPAAAQEAELFFPAAL